MERLKKYSADHKYFISFLIIYIVIRLLIFNINHTEWGDSFRLIRGAEYLARLSWPFDEKRLPFYPLLLIPGVWVNAPIFWGRLLSLFISIGIIFTSYYFYLRHVSSNKFYALSSVVFICTTPIFSYWSPRIMADILFALLVILFFFLFLNFYKDNDQKLAITSTINVDYRYILSAVLLAITMTRFEGIFVAASVGLFLLLQKKIKDIFMIFIPQALVFVPWFVYTKFLYQGEKQQNNYFDEVQTFVFDFERFTYFFIYTLFLLVIPYVIVFILTGSYLFIKKHDKTLLINYLPILIFILLEFLIGFIWTPSLPRIYVPIIPLLIIFLFYGIEKFSLGKKKWIVIASFLILLGLFIATQLEYRLYFLGASKLAMASVVGFSFLGLLGMVFSKKWKEILVFCLISINIVVSFVVIMNERNIYKTVKQGIYYVQDIVDSNAIVAYSDETGNTAWYFSENGIRPDFDTSLNADTQYKFLLENDADYMLWTNEFNRGSSFVEPEKDDKFNERYVLLEEYEEPAAGVVARFLHSIGQTELEGYFIYNTKVYKVIKNEL